MARRKLTTSQRLTNEKIYKKIRAAYNKLTNKPISYKTYKQRVLDIRGEQWNNKTIRTIDQAINRINNSTTFVPYAVRSKMNITHALRTNYPEVYKQISGLIDHSPDLNEIRNTLFHRGAGKASEQVIIDNLTYDKSSGNYSFTGKDGNTYELIITNSPQDVFIQQIV